MILALQIAKSKGPGSALRISGKTANTLLLHKIKNDQSV